LTTRPAAPLTTKKAPSAIEERWASVPLQPGIAENLLRRASGRNASLSHLRGCAPAPAHDRCRLASWPADGVNIVPRYEETDGFKGFTLLLDRSGGQGIGISFWENEDSMRASDELADQARRGAAEAGSGSDRGKEYFEVAINTMA
jgi:hypothetical protein